MHNQLVSFETRKKLRALSEYLKLTALTASPASFDMETYYSGGSSDCGSSACAVGHYALMLGWQVSPMGVMPKGGFGGVPSNCFLSVEGKMLWSDFSRIMLGVPSGGETASDWNWMFSADWEGVDNSILGAAARIDHYLENGVPDVFNMSTSSGTYTDESTYPYLDHRTALEAQQVARLLVTPLRLDPRVAE